MNFPFHAIITSGDFTTGKNILILYFISEKTKNKKTPKKTRSVESKITLRLHTCLNTELELRKASFNFIAFISCAPCSCMCALHVHIVCVHCVYSAACMYRIYSSIWLLECSIQTCSNAHNVKTLFIQFLFIVTFICFVCMCECMCICVFLCVQAHLYMWKLEDSLQELILSLHCMVMRIKQRSST